MLELDVGGITAVLGAIGLLVGGVIMHLRREPSKKSRHSTRPPPAPSPDITGAHLLHSQTAAVQIELLAQQQRAAADVARDRVRSRANEEAVLRIGETVDHLYSSIKRLSASQEFDSKEQASLLRDLREDAATQHRKAMDALQKLREAIHNNPEGSP